MIAQQFPQLLREFEDYRGAVAGNCPDEPQFHQLFEVLGDRQAQEDIRLAHPNVQHCDKLEINPKACIGCALNPMKPEKLAKKNRVEAGAVWIASAQELEQQSRLGLLTTEAINSSDMLLLSVARERQDFQRDERLSILIANQMGILLSKMFGAK